jgi:hypothetical protein
MSSVIGLQKLIIDSFREKDRQIVNPIFISVILVGFIIKIGFGANVSSTDGYTGPASSSIWGYGIIIMGLIGIIYSNLNPGLNEWDSIKNLPYSIILSIVLLSWLISLNTNYFKQINSLEVPDQFFMWSNYSTILLIFLLGISIIQFILYKIKADNSMSHIKNLNIYSYVLLFFNFITIVIQQIILDSFTVDG